MAIIDRVTTEMVYLSCWHEGCGVRFGMSEDHHRILVERGTVFHCLNGHRLSFGEGPAKAAQRERDAALQREKWAKEDAERQRNLRAKAERSQRATAGHLKRVKMRTAHGVCPCCNRTFADLARHMATKHPEETAAR